MLVKINKSSTSFANFTKTPLLLSSPPNKELLFSSLKILIRKEKSNGGNKLFLTGFLTFWGSFSAFDDFETKTIFVNSVNQLTEFS
jgi:hypothetical protein